MDCAVLNGVPIHFSDKGAADRPTLVFANSLGTDFRIWDGIIWYLEPQFRILRYDKRGHGLSGLGHAPCRMDDHIADLAALLDHRGISPATIIGLSVGGQIALGLATKRPDLVGALVLSDTAHRIGTPETWNERIAAVEANGLEGIGDAMMERWFSRDYRHDHPAALAIWRNMLTRTPTIGYNGTCSALRDSDLTTCAHAVAVPTLCICGELDIVTPPDLVQSMASLIPGAVFQSIPRVAHLPCIESPERFASLILAFVHDN